jgi:hypothetical protein
VLVPGVVLLLELELWACRTDMAEHASAKRRAKRRKEYIGIGLPPRDYGSTPPLSAALPPVGIKTSQGGALWVNLYCLGRSPRRFAPFALATIAFRVTLDGSIQHDRKLEPHCQVVFYLLRKLSVFPE